MTAAAADRRARLLPRGWRDLFRQLAIWFGFVARVPGGARDRRPQHRASAFDNGLQGHRHRAARERPLGAVAPELRAQSSTSSRVSMQWTYWLSQFAVMGARAAVGVPAAARVVHPLPQRRSSLANVIGLIGYVLLPTAPPRMFPEFGFVDTLASLRRAEPRRGLVQLASNPYAAMPSLHCGGRADRRDRAGRLRALVEPEGDLARVAGLGLVLGDGDRQPLLARHRRRDRASPASRRRSSTGARCGAASPGADLRAAT